MVWLVAFWDGSFEAHTSCVYVCSEWEDYAGESGVDVSLIYAKSRVAPMVGTTISKMQIQGSLLKVVLALDTVIDRVIMAGDSMCALMSPTRQGTSFKPFLQNRVAETLSNLRQVEERVRMLEQTLKVPTELNLAEVCARGKATLADIESNSVWQRGPQYL